METKRRGVWLEIPLSKAAFIPIAAKVSIPIYILCLFYIF
jgi:hypothetical protein